MPKNIIWLNGMPRSGTSWLSQIFDSSPEVTFRLSPLFSYAFKNRINEKSSVEEINIFFEEIYKSTDDFLTQREKRENGEYPTFNSKEKNPKILVIKDTRYHNLTKHLLHKKTNIKFIHIVRNPCAAINSWINADREFKNKGCSVDNDWKTGACRKTGNEEFWGFNDWKKLTKMYLELQDKYPLKVLVVKYENLVMHPFDLTKKMFKFSSLKFTEQTENFIASSQSRNYGGDYSVYRNKDVKDKWKEQLDKEIINEINKELINTPLDFFLE